MKPPPTRAIEVVEPTCWIAPCVLLAKKGWFSAPPGEWVLAWALDWVTSVWKRDSTFL